MVRLRKPFGKYDKECTSPSLARCYACHVNPSGQNRAIHSVRVFILKAS